MERAVGAWRAALFAIAVAFGQHAARAAEPAPLAWSAPAGCPSEQDVHAALAELSAGASSVAGATVEVVQRGAAWGARVVTPAGARNVEGESCAAVTEAVVVMLALAADAKLETNIASAEAPVAVPATRVPPAAPKPAPSARDVAPALTSSPADNPASSSDGFNVGVGWMAEVGLLPGVSSGPRLVLGVTSGGWAIEVAGAWLLEQRAALGAARADIHWIGGQLSLCRSLAARARACGGGELGQVVGEASGVDRALTAGGLWLAATASVALRAPVSTLPLYWEAGWGLAWALVRPQFGFEGLGVLHEASQASGRLWLGLGWN